MKKGQTESYSFLIGLIIAFLMLLAIGCAVYNIYKPQGAEYFNKMAKTFKDLEKKGIDVEEGEIAVYVEEDKAIVGFNKQEKKVKKPFFGLFGKKCYGIRFNKYILSVFGIESGIERPDKCPIDKSCLCVCKLSKGVSNLLYIHPEACKGMSVKCETFDNLELVGGKGCPYGVLIPGMKHSLEKRDVGLTYYKKKGIFVSIDDEEPKTEEDLKELIEEEKQKTPGNP